MRIRSLLLGASLLTALTANAIDAFPDPVEVTQPDGTTVMLRSYGNEHGNLTTTLDGYTVVWNEVARRWDFAILADGTLRSSGIQAADAQKRSAEAVKLLSTTPTFLREPAVADEPSATPDDEGPKLSFLHGKSASYDYSNFRGLVILVEYNDLGFSRSDIYDVFDRMLNEHDFTGFMSTSLLPEKIEYTGSVRDYYYDNSSHRFDPVFDLYGPVKIDYASTYVKQSAYASTIVSAALAAADSLVDFSRYDRDGDGTIDMIYLIFAGGGSNYSGNDSGLLWPHASTISGRYDGVSAGSYACSTELYGKPATKQIDGIGSIVHEFSHVLGLPDLYDTDYTSSGGTSVHPQKWSVMASGSYLNASRTPAGYSLYERYALGFASPQLVSESGDYELLPLDDSNTGLRIPTQTTNEYYLLENRKKQRWDAYLPGEGMLVFRVDSTSYTAWDNNDVNVNPKHNYYELLRATPKAGTSSTTDSAGDPFPGSGGVTSLSWDGTPAFVSWNGDPVLFSLSNIALTDGRLTLHVDAITPAMDREDFESVPVTASDTTLTGRFTTFTLSAGARVCTHRADTFATSDSNVATLVAGSGYQSVGLLRSSVLRTEAIARTVNSVSFDVLVPADYGSASANFYCQYSLNGSTWTSLANTDGKSIVSLTPGYAARLTYRTSGLKGAQYRFRLSSGSRTQMLYLDNLAFQYDPTEEPSGDAISSVSADGRISISTSGGRIVVRMADGEGTAVSVSDLSGRILGSARISGGEATIDAGPAHTVCILRVGPTAFKVVI